MYPNRSQTCGRVAGAHVQGLGPKASAPDGYGRFPTSGFAVASTDESGATVHRPTFFKRAASSITAFIFLFTAGCSANDGDWKVSNETDAMTDLSMRKAVTKIIGENFDAETTIVCASTGAVAYQFRTFDKAGDPAELRWAQVFGGPAKTALIRLDDGSPYKHTDSSRFSNQLLVGGFLAKKMAASTKIVMSLDPLQGKETYVFEQSDPSLRSVLSQCAEGAPQSAPSAGSRPALPVSAADQQTDVFAGPAQTVSESPPSGEQCWTPPSGPHVLSEENRPLSFQEVEEIERVTGRSYQEGDSIYGRVEDRCPA